MFEKRYRVQTADLDDLGHVNNVRYVQWIQDISKEHWQNLAPTAIQDKVAWVVLHHDISYKQAAVLDDEILIKTFIKTTKGATSIRTVEIYNDKTKTLLVRSNTEWCLLNANSHRPMRIPDEIHNIFHPDTAHS